MDGILGPDGLGWVLGLKWDLEGSRALMDLDGVMDLKYYWVKISFDVRMELG